MSVTLINTGQHIAPSKRAHQHTHARTDRAAALASILHFNLPIARREYKVYKHNIPHLKWEKQRAELGTAKSPQ